MSASVSTRAGAVMSRTEAGCSKPVGGASDPASAPGAGWACRSSQPATGPPVMPPEHEPEGGAGHPDLDGGRHRRRARRPHPRRPPFRAPPRARCCPPAAHPGVEPEERRHAPRPSEVLDEQEGEHDGQEPQRASARRRRAIVGRAESPMVAKKASMKGVCSAVSKRTPTPVADVERRAARGRPPPRPPPARGC